ncbi:MAG: DUF3365 domain-containing protein [Planctomycetes bacterium]|nr:DUF3365 domain-containing protein [Planctomycetota bacterium]
MKRKCRSIVLLFGMIVVSGCSSIDEERSEEPVPTAVELSAEQQQQKTIALAARDALFQQLLAKLMDTMASAGPAAAIAVCQKQAPEIAANVSQHFGLRIGRTSHRLRNPKNAPPDWAQPFVEDRTEEPQFVALPDGKLGAILPIRLKPQCLMCHGPEQQILPDVREALARSYPQDQATGFQEGELRGWFWVSVPADARLPVESEAAVPSTDADTSTSQ